MSLVSKSVFHRATKSHGQSVFPLKTEPLNLPSGAILLMAFYNHGKSYPMEDTEVNGSAHAGLNSSLIASNNGRIPAFP